MYKFLIKQGQTIAFLVGAGIAVIFGILIFIGIKDRSLAEMTHESLMQTSIFDFGLYATITLVAIAAFLVFVVFALIGLARDFRSSRKVLVGIAFIIILFFIFYATATPETAGKIADLVAEKGISENTSKFISAGMKTMLSLLGLSVVIWFGSEIRNALK